MPSIAHFEIPFDNSERARKFYTELFGWTLERYPGMEYWMIRTQEGAGGGMVKRQNPDHRMTDYFGVSSVSDYSASVERLGGKVLMPKMAVPNMGYFAVCMDTEGNVFGLWEEDPKAR